VPNSRSRSPAPSETDDLIAEQLQDLIPNKSYTMTELSRKIPTLHTKLTGASTYPEWIISIESYLDLVPAGPDYRVWDVVTGSYEKPTATTGRELRSWKDANAVALLTMRKNCEDDVKARIGNLTSAKDAYAELKKAYEGKTATEFYALLDSLTSISFDDRKSSIEEHVTNYERAWNRFVGVVSRADLTTDDGFGKGLREFASSDKAKAEFLLKSLPTVYANTIENVRAKDYGYDDVARKLKEYIPMRQKSKKGSMKNDTEGSAENPIILKADKKKDSSKQCDYCKEKGWKGIGHTESEYFTKKREQKVVKKTKTFDDTDDEEDEVYVGTVRIKIAIPGNLTGEYQYDTGTTHHTTNEFHRLSEVEEVNIEVEAHDGTKSICKKRGTLTFRHNGREIKLKDTLYDLTYSNLISGQRITENHCLEVNSEKRTAKLKIGKKVIYKMRKDLRGGLWVKPDGNKTMPVVKTFEVSELHERYGHISFNTLKSLPECPKFHAKPRCEACEKGKATKPPARNQQKKDPKIRTTRPLERIHADLIGPIKPVTPGNQFKYLLTTTDDFSRYVVTKPIKMKSDTTDALIEIIDAFETACNPSQTEQQLILKVHQVQANWGGEFRNDRLAEKLRKRGIQLKETVPGHSETNAIIERTNRTIMTMNRTAILGTSGGIPKGRWDKASGWSAYTKNRVPHKTLEGKSPLEILFLGKDIHNERKNLRPFGQEVICFDYNVTDKLSARSYEARIVGYTLTHRVYQVIDKNERQRVAKDPKPLNLTEIESSDYSSEEDADNEPENNTPIKKHS
jgi:hypothetical protein